MGKILWIMPLVLIACASPRATWYGLTFCTESGAKGVVDVDVIGTELQPFVVEHERRHKEQVRRFRSCGAYRVWYAANRAAAEVEAFCAGIRAMPDYDAALWKAAAWLSGGYPDLRMSHGQALVAIGSECPRA